MAHVPPAILPVAPAAAPQRTCVNYCADDSHDAAQGHYPDIMDVFVAPAVNPPPALTIANAVLSSAVVDPQAFIALISDDAHPLGRVMLFHWLQHFDPQLGNPTPLNNNACAFCGNVLDGQAPPSVQWPDDAFHQAGVAACVPTRAATD